MAGRLPAARTLARLLLRKLCLKLCFLVVVGRPALQVLGRSDGRLLQDAGMRHALVLDHGFIILRRLSYCRREQKERKRDRPSESGIALISLILPHFRCRGRHLAC